MVVEMTTNLMQTPQTFRPRCHPRSEIMSTCGKVPCNCLTYRGECFNARYVYAPEPSDYQSDLIRRCAMGIDLGADKGSVLQLCYDAGQSPEHAELSYIAAQLLIKWRAL
jgi:hypothetical protein